MSSHRTPQASSRPNPKAVSSHRTPQASSRPNLKAVSSHRTPQASSRRIRKRCRAAALHRRQAAESESGVKPP
ncbi:MAG TPA: hypothetical protein PLB32_03560, partial [Acidobacteriota bacterium]|nr:hypothetical protein [Acidobacteriota bacterium]